MLRISQTGKTEHPCTLKLEGQVVGPWVDELRQIGESILAESRALRLDLNDVSYADPDGIALLVALRANGTRLLAATPFLVEQLKSSDAAAKESGLLSSRK